MSFIQKFKSIKVLRIFIFALILIFTGKILDYFHFQNVALLINLVAFFFILYSLISAIESKGKK